MGKTKEDMYSVCQGVSNWGTGTPKRLPEGSNGSPKNLDKIRQSKNILRFYLSVQFFYFLF